MADHRKPSSLRPRGARKFLRLGRLHLSLRWERTSPRCGYIRGRKDNGRHWLPFALVFSTGRGKRRGFRTLALFVWGLVLGVAWKTPEAK